MADWVRIRARVMPIAQAIPRKVSALRAEVLPTLRKHGSLRQVAIPSCGDVSRRSLRSGYDLIHQASPAPLPITACEQ
jgi:hypothetical protein